MRWQTKEFVKKFVTDHWPGGTVLEVGSLDVNGTVKELFPSGYTGVDMRSGSNVDIVCNGHDLVKQFGEESFDTVVCFDTIEHDDKFWITLDQMKKVLKKGGWLLLGAPSLNCPLHDHPSDYWRFMPASFNVLFEGLSNTLVEPENSDEIYGYGQKTQD